MSETNQDMENEEIRSEILNLPVCDLRSVTTVEAARRIGRIVCVATLILPKDALPEVKAILAAVPKENVAMILELPMNSHVQICNGEKELNDSCFAPDGSTIWIVNGFAIIRHISPETRGMVYVNGLTCISSALQDTCQLSLNPNGKMMYLDFSTWKSWIDLEVDAEFLSYLEPKTLLMVANHCLLKRDVTPEMLKEKKLEFFVGNQITCYPQLAAYIRAHAFVGHSVNVLQSESDG